ncbi:MULTISPECIES: sulfotransferase family 2 domain-containing protein [unclassified Halomonas]|uniref:sulfotransferase family 2 domain-containing protein n=1 Tax=unclassified Halomonas TaxID=2609666 RepID=UPI001EF53BBD|nr:MULTISPECIES: sulfotransferase family 2 domain-containing protein [unclassified Halomonas]MCG7577213.1 sulfotransferase family protein [Halomonas sp. MMH1-48]MCG7604278.1 sulfotransferase family protein [Halomonas sp. MM17-34]MCG7613527.1 sulfotransferase family protein [Halomonas sp. MM17-29]MCG7620301.1 sulfotransferase family protein [Halomonas sp. DSH1-27]
MSIINEMLKKKTYKELDLNTHISLKNEYVFFQVSKVASSTIKNFLQEIEVAGTSRKVIDVNNRYVSPHVWPTQLKEDKFISIIESPSFKKISFVRNPYSRVLSCYLHRIIKDVNSPSNKSLAKYTGGLCGPKITFSDFVKVISEQEPKQQESHWRIQSEEIFFDVIPNWDFIGRFENLKNDLNILDSLLKLKNNNSSFDESVNKSPMATGANDKLKSYFDDNTQELIYNSYAADFINFNYGKEL